MKLLMVVAGPANEKRPELRDKAHSVCWHKANALEKKVTMVR
jgi:hypothetical protein